MNYFLCLIRFVFLAKRGVCLYSGSPLDLKTHLIECNVKTEKDLTPIEVLLEISSKDTEENQMNILSINTKEKNKNLYNDCLNEKMRPTKGMAIISKRFSLKDFILLFLRFMTYTYKCNYKTTLVQFLMIFAFAFSLKQTVNYDMIKEDGCIKLEIGMGCKTSLIDIKKEYFIRQNINYNILLVTCITCLTLILTAVMCFKGIQNISK